LNQYCSITQLKMLYDLRTVIELSDDTATNTEQDTTLQFVLDVAASDLDSVFTNRFPIPLPTVPLVVTGKCAALAMKRLFSRRSDIPKGIQADIDAADRWIEQIIAGRVNIPGIDRNAPTLSYSGAKDGSSRFDHLPLQDNSGNTSDSVSGGRIGKLG